MAKKFAGFTPEQMGKIVPEMQGMQGDEQAKFLAANPAAASRVGKMAELAQKRIGMAEGGFATLDERLKAQAQGYAPAGMIQPTAARPRPAKIEPNMLQRPIQMPNDFLGRPVLGDLRPNVGTLQPAAVKVPGTIAETIRPGISLPMEEYGITRPDVPNLGTATATLQPKEQSIPPHSHTIGGVQAMNRGGYARGGQATLDAAQKKYADAQNALTTAQQNLAANPEDASLKTAVEKAQIALTNAQAELQSATAAFTATEPKSLQEMQAEATSDPMKMVTQGQVSTVSDADKAEGTIAAGTGQAGPAPQATATTATAAPGAAAPTATPAATTTAATAEQGVQQVMDDTQAAQGTVSAGAQVTAAQGDTSQLSQLQLEAAQGAAAQIQGAPTRTVQQLEMISGSTVDQAAVQQIYGTQQLEAATVSGEMDRLMQDFENGKTPAWAAGAMRAATAKMAARGLSASSMAGMAVVQAAMESALPIAQMDAANKQQVALESARQRANFLNMEFTQEFQAKVQNAAKISEIANMNFTAEQQVALENAKMAQTMNLANLSNRQAKVMADAATMAQMDLTNLNNRQQAQVQNAKAFLQMDMANLSNEQQTAIFKAQQMTNTLLSDAAAENAARQFNASSENQTNQFFANLASQVERFNTEQSNQMSRFNAGEANAITQFNATQQAAREQFNANNQLVIAQANAQWFQSITTAETAAQNQMNRDAAIQASKMTETAYNAAVQMERDTISYAFRAGESQAERDLEIVLQGMRNAMTEAEIQAQVDTAKGKGWGTIANTVVELGLKKIFGM